MVEDQGASALSSGEVLKEIRLGLGFTQHELATRLDYSRSVVANAESGREISPRYLQKLAEKFPKIAKRLEDVRPTAERPREETSHDPLEDRTLNDVFFRRSDKTTALDGDWFALWETTANRTEVLNIEQLVFKMKRDGSLLIQNVAISGENPEGGYLWISRARVFDNQYILGTYIPREANVRSKGCFYLVLHPSGRYINGQWIGCNYDGDWARGLVVMARGSGRLRELMDKHRKQIPSMPYNKQKADKGARNGG
jgi:transcriptional regulator with XRE-family HTH domain